MTATPVVEAPAPAPPGAADPRERLLGAALALGVLVMALTEGLGAAGALSRGPALIGWALVAGAAAMGTVWVRRAPGGHGRAPSRAERRAALSPLDTALLGWVGLLALVTGLTAVLAVPTTWDGLTYHLPRVVHWAQNGTVAFYPTHIIRQLYQSPWAEFAALHLALISGGDRLVHLVQWTAMAGSLVGVSLIARRLGGGPRGQVLAAFACATIPMGILQASSSQNDYVEAFWLVCLAHALLALDDRPGGRATLAAGAALGLALATKATGYLFALPFLLALALIARRCPLRMRVARGGAILVCAAVLIAPATLRNAALFHAPFGGEADPAYRYENEEVSARIAASGVARNLALHMGTPWRAVNARVQDAVLRAHDWLGVAVDDPRTTWPKTRLLVMAPLAHEDSAGNGVHLVLIAGAGAAVLWRAWSAPDRRRLAYLAALAAAALLFCVVLRWQPWHSRLHLPLFVLGAPLVGVALERLNGRWLLAGALVLAIGSSYYATRSHGRRLVGPDAEVWRSRASQRVAHAERVAPAYLGAARFLASTACRHIGLVLRSDDPEYLLWSLAPAAASPPRFEHVLVANRSGRVAAPGSGARPCAIVRTVAAPEPGVALAGRTYERAWAEGGVEVLLPAADPPVDAAGSRKAMP